MSPQRNDRIRRTNRTPRRPLIREECPIHALEAKIKTVSMLVEIMVAEAEGMRRLVQKIQAGDDVPF